MAKTYSTFRPELIYIFRINDIAHSGCLKIGKTTMPDEASLDEKPNSHILNEAARERIRQYTHTAGIKYDLLYTESSIAHANKQVFCINDTDVHQVLLRSGIERTDFGEDGGREWFNTDLETAKRAIAAAKQKRTSLLPQEISIAQSPIVFRPEQKEAIERTCKRFGKSNRMLWNAKMRFGKTLSALEVIRRMGYCRTIILTHRPVVNAGWYDDFQKIFRFETTRYDYGSKEKGNHLADMENACRLGNLHYVYFASMQDLRGSEQVGGKFDKNHRVFNINWDCIIVDEAHEGTQTQLGQNVLEALTKPTTKVLQLSGTPFNLFNQYKEDEIYTWDYVMEQRAKAQWDETHFGDPNPYSGLPTMNIYTFDLGRLMAKYMDMDVAFNFTEFFRTRDNGTFVHEQDVRAFLDLLTKPDKESLFPFSNEEFRRCFHHTLWMLPGVRAAKALSALLQDHPVFGNFEIVNVAGEGDDDAEKGDALELVQKAIRRSDYTITLSCGKLTTGVSVPEWTAVMMLSGTFNTAASSYMQTIFRVQTPATINGLRKENCYVFDFAPDRTLRVIAETAKVQAKAGKTTENDRKTLGEFLNFCPIIACEGTQMKDKITANQLFEQLKKVYVERVVSSGFDTGDLYSEELLKMDNLALQDFKTLKGIIGTTKAMPKAGEVDINTQGLTDEQREQIERIEKKKRKREPLTEEEEEQLQQLSEAKKQRTNAISILRGISIRMPLLIYGAELTQGMQDVTLANFTEIIDDGSWGEFMPKGVTKLVFANFRKYYDQDIFLAAGRRIRALAEAADRMTVEQRIHQIVAIFNAFRNPDKETVLTPWRVVNRHLSDTIGGYCFYNENFTDEIDEPRYIEQANVTRRVFTPETYILEINSKSGLYPLYAAYSTYRAKVANALFSTDTIEEQQRIWDEVVRENIFVICKTQMARSITRRTLLGFRYEHAKGGFDNLYVPDDLINRITNEQTKLIEQINKGQTFKNFKNMKFNAIVGNPPYQVMDGGAGASAKPIYQCFVEVAKKLHPDYISLIMPSRWMTGGKGLDDFRDAMISDKHLQLLHDYADSSECFSGVEIKGGVCYFLWNSKYNDKCHIYRHNIDGVSYSNRYLKEEGCDIYIRENVLVGIKEKVRTLKEATCDLIASPAKLYGLRGDAIKSRAKYGLPPMSEKPITGGYTLLGLDGNMKRIYRYLPKDYPFTKADGLNKYKIFISESYGCGEIGEISATPVLATPGMLCTETFIQIGPFDTKQEMENCAKYMKTKLFRALVGIRKQTQHATRSVYSFVPQQDFKTNQHIDWSQNIADIDRQLYTKYHLSPDEIAFIEKTIHPME